MRKEAACFALIFLLTSGCTTVRHKSANQAETFQAPPTPLKVANPIPPLGLLKEKIKLARDLLETVSVGPYTCRKTMPGHKKKTVELEGREIALGIYSPARDTVEIVKFQICFRDPENLRVLTPHYAVTRLSGSGITRFVFSVVDAQGEGLIVLISKQWLAELGQEEYYIPYSDIFLREDFLKEGVGFLFAEIHGAKRELREHAVPSRAFPGKLLADVFPDTYFANLALNEQMDESESSLACPNPNTFPPELRTYSTCIEYAAFKVLVHLALNKEMAFSFVHSKKGAAGLMQFMPASYNMVVGACPLARLITDAATGSAHMRNAIKAAMCLSDYYLAMLPKGAIDEFERNHRLGGIYPVAAYNGGPQNAIRLYRSLGNRDIDTDNFKAPRHTIVSETSGYVGKFLLLWGVLDRFHHQ